MLIDLPLAALAHRRQQPEDQPDRAEVVELHRPLEVVEALLGLVDRAPDRAAGVVDEHVDGGMVGEDAVAERVDRVEVVEVARMGLGRCRARRS